MTARAVHDRHAREDAFANRAFDRTASTARLSRVLAALIRISATISAVRGFVALERPLLELIADVVRFHLQVLHQAMQVIRMQSEESRRGLIGKI